MPGTSNEDLSSTPKTEIIRASLGILHIVTTQYFSANSTCRAEVSRLGLFLGKFSDCCEDVIEVLFVWLIIPA